jgi:hypothetical protein
MRQPRPAVHHLERVNLGAGCGGRPAGSGGQQADERAVAASIVENPTAAKALGQRDADFEAAAMAVGDEAILGKDLLRGVMTFAQRGIDGRFAGQNFFSRASQVPRMVIQKDNKIRRRSRKKDRRRMYKRSNRNFCRRDTSRGA